MLAAAVLALLQGAAPPVDDGALDAPAIEWDARAVEHLYNRAGFGARPEEILEGLALGPVALVERLLEGGEDWPDEELAVFRWEDFGFDHRQLPLEDAAFLRLDHETQVEMCKDTRELDRGQFIALEERFFHSMIAGGSPLRERMTLFWHGFFTTSLRVNKRKYELIHQFRWFRHNALGSYAELLRGIVRDPAMLQYLDNTSNWAEHPNENLARELMELFSLGQGNYSEQDVREAARALTGYAGASNGQFEFLAEHHDGREKTVLGVTGALDAEDLVEILLAQEACAVHVARRLLVHLEGLEPAPERLASYAATLREHGYALRPFLRRLFLDPEFYSPERRGARVQGGIEFLASLGHRLGAAPGGLFLHRAASFLGQEFYGPPSVKGWPEGLEWITGDALLRRAAIAGIVIGAFEPPPDVAALGSLSSAGPALSDELLSMREELGSEPWRPAQELLGRLRTIGADSDARIAGYAAEAWLGVPPSAELKDLLTAALAADRVLFGVEDGALLDHPRLFELALRRLAHLVFSLPEAQLS
jgi:hypothetical protein